VPRHGDDRCGLDERRQQGQRARRRAKVFAVNEPRPGCKMHDVDRLVALLDRMVDGGTTGDRHRVRPRCDRARTDRIIDLGPGLRP
jgi:excinuclease UvrABC ATPase subunit